MVWLALFMVVIAYGHTVITYDVCPRHSDAFDAWTCENCGILMHRQQEINEMVARFEQGYVPHVDEA